MGKPPAGERPRGERLGRVGLAAKAVQVVLVVLLAAALIVSVSPPLCYTNDLQNDYLPARAYRDGLDVFTPLDELSARYFPVGENNFRHPSPHPPAMTLLFSPLTLLPIEVLAPLWLALSVVLLVFVGRGLGLSVLGSLTLGLWPPIFQTLAIGQWEVIVLALAVLGWRAAAERKDWRAGILFGLAAFVKLYPGLLVLPFLLRGRVRLVASAALVAVAGQVVSLLTVGLDGLVRYWTEVLPSVAQHYSALGVNSSPHGALLRLLGGSAQFSPVIQAPELVLPITVVISALSLLATRRARPEAGALAILAALPNVWGTYATLALPQIVCLWRQPRYRLAVVLATVAASYNLMISLGMFSSSSGSAVELLATRFDVGVTILGAVQAVGYLALLLLSVLTTSADHEC